MWKETEVLQKIVSDNAWISHNSGSVHLQESDSSASLRSVFIDNVSKDGITLKLDYDTDSFFRHNYGNRRCDFIILSNTLQETDRVALFIDMKSTNFSDADVGEKFPHDLGNGYPDYIPQLRSSSCFFEFLHIVMKEFCSCSSLIHYIKRRHRFFVVLHNKNMNAITRPIVATRPKRNDSLQKALILYADNDAHLNFESLVLR